MSSFNDDCKHLVKITFLYGYTARQMFALIDSLVGEIPIYFYRDRFEIKYVSVLEQETGKKVGIKVIPIMKRILNYETNPAFFTDDEKVIQMNPYRSEFMEYLKTTNKKDSIDFCVKTDSPDSLWVNINKNCSNGVNNINFKNNELENFTVYVDEYGEPNINIPLNELCNSCVLIGKRRNDFKGITFIGYKKGLKIIGEKYTNSSVLGTHWGLCTDEIGRYALNMEKVKALSNINSITENGVISFYFSSDKMRMDIPISYYADMIVTFCNGKEMKRESEKSVVNSMEDTGIDKYYLESC